MRTTEKTRDLPVCFRIRLRFAAVGVTLGFCFLGISLSCFLVLGLWENTYALHVVGSSNKCPVNNEGTNKSCLTYLRKKMRNERALHGFPFPEWGRRDVSSYPTPSVFFLGQHAMLFKMHF
jgi:hypothetical protein